MSGKKSAKLTAAQVQEIRRKYTTTAVSMTQLAKEKNVTPGCISAIITRKTWKGVS